MKNIYLIGIFKSVYCQIVFVISLVGGYLLVPKSNLSNYVEALVYLFIILFALVVTCMVRNIKERVVLSRTYGSSIIGTIMAGLGLAALQVCGVGAPVCGATIGVGVLSAIFPSFFLSFLEQYNLEIFLFSVGFQFLALYFMNCFKQFKKVKSLAA